MLDKAPVRLLTLDFVLTDPDRQYLEEENDKVEFLVRERAISAEILPAKSSHGGQGAETHRYFVENFPVFLSQGNGPAAVNFTYIEDDIRSIRTFTSFVERYRPLFDALTDGFKLIFVAQKDKRQRNPDSNLP